MKLPPDESDCTSDLSQWFHCASNKGLPDTVLSQAWDVVKSVSFVFHHRSAAAEVKPDANSAQTVDEDEAIDELKTSKGKSRFREDDEDVDVSENDDDSDEDFVL